MSKITKVTLVALLSVLCLAALAEGGKVIYKYRKNEKFDFEELSLDGDFGNPGDLSIIPRYHKKYRNRLPYRKNFNSEIRKAVDKIR
ncbi:MAG: hypothetical protein KAG61_10525 [Bacteriovoracaceae bacterium]|nr:hypothetical protein [Bacteriovoracaceae bacterium]